MNIFNNKNVLITGASSGIGKSFAYFLAKKKANLILVARNKKVLEEIKSDLLKTTEVTITVIEKDLSIIGSSQEIYNQLSESSITIDYLINNAGFGIWDDFLDVDYAKYKSMNDLNINSLTEMTYQFLPDIIKSKNGGLINLGSTGALVPVGGSAVYTASKAYVLHFTDAIHSEYANDTTKIMTLCPGATATNFSNVASDKKIDNSDITNLSEGYMTPDEVVQIAIESFVSNKIYVVPGRKNYITSVFMPRILTRHKLVSLVRSSWVKKINQYSNKGKKK